MPKILITGNGFDLYHHLPTKYSEFIQVMMKIEKIEEKVNYFFEDFFKDLNYDEILQRFFKIKNLTFDNNDILFIKNSLINNVWFQYFKDELSLESWIDFESKIEKVIKSTITFIKKVRLEILKNPKQYLPNYFSSIIDNNIEIIKILEKLKLVTLSTSDSGKLTIKISKEFLTCKYDYYIDIDEDKILSYLKDQLDDFKYIFNYYFDLFINSFLENSKFLEYENYLKNIDYYFTFNYTDTYKKLYKNLRIKENIFHVHGKCFLEKGNLLPLKINSIVLGFGDIDDTLDNKKFYFPFTKYYQKLNNNTDYRFIKEIVDEKNDDSWYLYIWGHSLDISDKDYIDEIFEFLLKKEYNPSYENKCFIIYHDEKSKSNMLLNLLNIRGRNDVELCMRNNKLKFISADDETLNKYFNLKEKRPVINDPGFF